MPQFASEAAGAQEPTIIGVYTHKGGTGAGRTTRVVPLRLPQTFLASLRPCRAPAAGKTTHTAMMGAMLAKEGYTVIMVDADPQMRCMRGGSTPQRVLV